MRVVKACIAVAVFGTFLLVATADSATAQPWCADCIMMEGELENGGGRDGLWWNCGVVMRSGYLQCMRPNYDQCFTSQAEDGGRDCGVALRLDGRAVRYAVASGSDSVLEPRTVRGNPEGGVMVDGGLTTESARFLIRRTCSGAIVRRHYSLSAIQAVRSELRRISV